MLADNAGGIFGGQGGIRTHGELPPTTVFKTVALNHSATCPLTKCPLAIQQSDGKGRCGLSVGSSRDRMWAGWDQSISHCKYNVPIYVLQLKWGPRAH